MTNQKLDSISFPIDHFGVVSAQLFKTLFTQDGDKRKRKVAFNSIRTMAKQFGMLPKDAEVEFIGLTVDKAGQIFYRIDYSSAHPHDKVEPITTEDFCAHCKSTYLACVELRKEKHINCCTGCTHG